MAISRRNFLTVAGAGVVATAIDAGGLLGQSPVASATGESLPAVDLPGRGVFGGLTTLDVTVARQAPINGGGYRMVGVGPGEAHVVRFELAGPGYRHPTLALAAFAQMTDLHIVDDQSPLRVEFTDRQADPPNSQNFATDSAYRPHEFLSTHVVEAMTRAIRNVGKGPMTGLPLGFTIVTGDMVDNVQFNETRWYIDLLDGGRQIWPDSGQIGREESVSDQFGLNEFGQFAHSGYYWYPESTDYVLPQ
jgi:hypothetical protein